MGAAPSPCTSAHTNQAPRSAQGGRRIDPGSTLGRPTIDCGEHLSAVGVPWAPTVADGVAAAAPGRPTRRQHVDDPDGAVAELLVEPPHDGSGKEPDLGGPGG